MSVQEVIQKLDDEAKGFCFTLSSFSKSFFQSFCDWYKQQFNTKGFGRLFVPEYLPWNGRRCLSISRESSSRDTVSESRGSTFRHPLSPRHSEMVSLPKPHHLSKSHPSSGRSERDFEKDLNKGSRMEVKSWEQDFMVLDSETGER